MAKFTISAYQEMFADEEIEADDVEQALLKFQTLLNSGEIAWRPSAEDMYFTVSEHDEAGHLMSEVSSDSLALVIKV